VIDQKLEESGYVLQDYKDINPRAATGVNQLFKAIDDIGFEAV